MAGVRRVLVLRQQQWRQSLINSAGSSSER